MQKNKHDVITIVCLVENDSNSFLKKKSIIESDLDLCMLL